jgi:hypothetical protein
VLTLLAASSVQSSAAPFQEPTCLSSSEHSEQIISDRPDISTSVNVVPQGSLQIGNGLGWTSDQGSQTVDGPQTTLRAGVAHCTEAILDPPDYSRGVRGTATSGFSPLELAVKRQLFRLPGAVNISAEAGLGLPVANHTGSCNGYESFVQIPWNRQLGNYWSANGMVAFSWFSGQSSCSATLEPTFVLSRSFGTDKRLLAEYVGEFARHGPPGSVHQCWRVVSANQNPASLVSFWVRFYDRGARSILRPRIYFSFG